MYLYSWSYFILTETQVEKYYHSYLTEWRSNCLIYISVFYRLLLKSNFDFHWLGQQEKVLKFWWPQREWSSPLIIPSMLLHSGGMLEQSRHLSHFPPTSTPERSFVSAAEFNNRQEEIKPSRYQPWASAIHPRPWSPLNLEKWKKKASNEWGWEWPDLYNLLQWFLALPSHCPIWEEREDWLAHSPHLTPLVIL